MELIEGWLRHRWGGKYRMWHFVRTHKESLSLADVTICNTMPVVARLVCDISYSLPEQGKVCSHCKRKVEKENR